jgi:hypothetical protein
MDSEKRRNMLYLIRSRACKKCGGDLSVESDIYGVYVQCIQCGANWSKADILALSTPNTVKSQPAEKVAQMATPAHRT